MEKIKLKVQDQAGNTLLTAPADQQVSLVYCHAYQPGDTICLEIDTPGQYCVIQLDDTMAPTLVYVQERFVSFAIPFGAQAEVYSPKSFQGSCHVIRGRLAGQEEILKRRNLALNPYDQHRDVGMYPHASANVETRGEAMFAARNAIDGVFENTSHGNYPYESWGINRDPNAAMTVAFGRKVRVDEIRLTLRGDYPHDNHWVSGVVVFSDGSREKVSLTDSLLPQTFPIVPREVTWLTLQELIPAPGNSPFPALTQLEAWGTESSLESGNNL